MNNIINKIFAFILGIIILMSVLNALSDYLLYANGFIKIIITIVILVIFFGMLHWAFNFSFISHLFMAITIALKSFFWFVFYAGRRWEGARYLGFIESSWFLRSSNKGFLVDGKSARLSEQISYQSLLTVGGMGKGKSSAFVMPNLYSLDHRSLVISDTSGEIYEQTSGYLKKQGFYIQVLNLMDTHHSLNYNPLERANSFTEIQKVAHLIIRSSVANRQDDQFWNAGAEKILRILIQCLKNRSLIYPKYKNFCNLEALKYLLNNFDAHSAKPGTSKIDKFVMDSTLNDPSTWNDYKGFTTGNLKTMLSFLSTADTALTALGNPDIAKLTAHSGIDFSALRKRKTALYLMVRQQDLSYYAFLLNLFYSDLFSYLLSDVRAKGLPVYFLLDEFGHLTIPDFAIYATTARKYRVAFWIFLQSLSQLESRYGKDEAKTILDGLQTEIYLSGLGLETAEILSKRMGRRRRKDRTQHWQYGDEGLLNPDEIITMEDDEALLFYSNKRPIRYKIKPYFKQWGMLQKSKLKPSPLPRSYKEDVEMRRL